MFSHHTAISDGLFVGLSFTSTISLHKLIKMARLRHPLLWDGWYHLSTCTIIEPPRMGLSGIVVVPLDHSKVLPLVRRSYLYSAPLGEKPLLVLPHLVMSWVLLSPIYNITVLPHIIVRSVSRQMEDNCKDLLAAILTCYYVRPLVHT